MRLSVSFVAMLLLIGGVGRAQDCSSTFSQSVAMLQNGKIQIVYQVRQPVFTIETRTITETVCVPESVTVDVNGKPEVRTVIKQKPVEKEIEYTVEKSVCEIRTRELDEASAAAFDVAGKPIEWAELTKRLAKPTLVVVSANGKPLAAQVAAIFKPETIVLVPPMEAPPLPSDAPRPVEAPAPAFGGGAPIEASAPAILPVDPPVARPRPVPTPVPAPEPVPVRGEMGQRGTQNLFRLAAYQTITDAPAQGAADGNATSMTAAPPPNVHFASLAGDGVAITEVNTYENTVYITVPKTDDAGKPTGALKKVPVVKRNETRASTIYPTSTIHAETVDGRKVPADILTRYLKTERAVLVASEGAKIDKFWLQNIKPTTVILQVPPVESGYGAFGPPAPTPPAPVAPPPPPLEAVPATEAAF